MFVERKINQTTGAVELWMVYALVFSVFMRQRIPHYT